MKPISSTGPVKKVPADENLHVDQLGHVELGPKRGAQTAVHRLALELAYVDLHAGMHELVRGAGSAILQGVLRYERPYARGRGVHRHRMGHHPEPRERGEDEHHERRGTERELGEQRVPVSLHSGRCGLIITKRTMEQHLLAVSCPRRPDAPTRDGERQEQEGRRSCGTGRARAGT